MEWLVWTLAGLAPSQLETIMNKKDSIYNQQQLIEIIDFYRGVILDACEQEIPDPRVWKYLRSRLLKALGERGLEGRIKKIIFSSDPM